VRSRLTVSTAGHERKHNACRAESEVISVVILYQKNTKPSGKLEAQGLNVGFTTVNAAQDSINVDLDFNSKTFLCQQASNILL